MAETRGQRLRLARKRKGLTQKQLEAKSAVSQRLISELENDKRPQISANILERLADALDETLDWVQKGEKEYNGDHRSADMDLIPVEPHIGSRHPQ